MKIWKKTASLVVSVIMIASMVACAAKPGVVSTSKYAATAADPFGRLPETVTITIGKGAPADTKLPAGETLENNAYVRYISNMLNVKYVDAWTVADTAYYEKVPLVLASGDIPDVMVVHQAELKQMYDAGMIEDLTTAYNENACAEMKANNNAIKGISLDSATFDGKLMAIPSLSPGADAQSMLWVRDDWMKKLGLAEPKTIDDIMAIAKAFIEKDPDGNGKDDTVGFVGQTKIATVGNSIYGFDPVFALYKSFPKLWQKDNAGNVVYGSITPQTKTALAKLNEMYKKGLIDKEFAAKNATKSNELTVGGKCGIFFGPWWMPNGALSDSVKQDPKADWKTYLAPLDASGKFNTHMLFPSTTYLVVKKGFAHPEAVVRTLNVQLAKMGTEVAKDTFYPGQKVAFQWTDQPFSLILGDYYQIENITKDVQTALAGKVKPDDLKVDRRQVYDFALAEKANPKADISKWSLSTSYLTGCATLLSDKLNQVFGVYNGQTATMNQKWANLTKLEDTTFLDIIMGDKSVDTFDKFVTDWKAQGGDQITKEVTSSLK
jgi:putative aldouronate transport system substrate-binding protein